MADTRSALQATLTKQVPPWVQQYLSYVVGAVFACAAVAIVWILVNIFINHYAARSWVAVPASVTSAEIRESRSGTLTRPTSSSRVAVTYRYTYNDREFTGKRVDFSFGSDNFSDTRRARQMKILSSPEPMIYLNPLRPEESVVDRSLPMEQVNFATLFLFFPCGLGTLMLMGGITSLAGLIGWNGPARFIGPAFGMLHALPAFYAPLVTPQSLGPFGWCIVGVASLTILASLRSVWRRIQDPTIGLPEKK